MLDNKINTSIRLAPDLVATLDRLGKEQGTAKKPVPRSVLIENLCRAALADRDIPVPQVTNPFLKDWWEK